jgi:predicted alpha-1,2-mannosidase
MSNARRFLIVLLAATPIFSACKAKTPVSKMPPPMTESCYMPPAADPSEPIAATAPFARYVDPFIGTGGDGFGVGSAFPGPERPFGMVRPGPDTMQSSHPVPYAHCAGYSYADTFIYGFSQTRMHGTGIVDYGTIGFMPTSGMSADKTNADGRKATFSHSTENASPGRYEVTLDGKTKVEITATDHVALYRTTFPSSSDATILFDIGHALPTVTIVDGHVDIDPASGIISGFAHFQGGYSARFGGMPVYFAARFDRPFASSGVWKAGVLAPNEASRDGGNVGAWATFDATTNPSVGTAIAISFEDVDHAKKNLAAEAPSFDFDGTAQAAASAWEALLSRMQIAARSTRDLTIQYTALYHTLLMPTLATEADGTYRGLDLQTHVADGFRYYTDFSLWDTYRTLHPWLSLLYPDIERDMVRSLTAMSVESGAPPQWVLGIGETGGMVGDSTAIVLGDSYARGVRDFDVGAAYGVLFASATTPLPKGGRSHVSDYISRGYVPIESGGAAGASTLEYAEDDFGLAVLANALGKTADAQMLSARSSSWKNLWDPKSQYLLGRHADGSFPTDDVTQWQPYWAEGSTQQYTWFVPHDVAGLAQTMGGTAAFEKRLDDFFRLSSCETPEHILPKTYYWQSNEPVLAIPWMFADLDDAALSAQWVRWALAQNYGDGPDGLPGNDDSGAMSAWALFGASGIYPRIGTSEYLIGAPTLPSVTLQLPGGAFVIHANGPSNGYPASATLNGKKLSRPRFDQADIANGGTLEIQLIPTAQAWQ